MHKKIIYLVVKLELASNEKITDKIYQEVVQEIEYDFISNTEGVAIATTEIKEVSESFPQ